MSKIFLILKTEFQDEASIVDRGEEIYESQYVILHL